MKNSTIDKLLNEIRTILINEDKQTNIIVNTIGLPTEISDWITTSFNEKFQLWFANNFKVEATKRIARDQENVKNAMLKLFKGDSTQASLRNQLRRQKDYFDGAFRHISDWLRNRRELAPETDDVSLKNLTFDEAINRANRWHEAVARLKAGAIVDESGRIIKTYEDGFYWIDLMRSRCNDEAKAMGHCGSGDGNLYSLRKAKHPYLTGDVLRGNLVQLRGRANTKPKEEYHSKIMDFLLNDQIGIRSMSPNSYRPQQNFELKDLSIDKLIVLYTQKPTLFSPSELYKVLVKYPAFASEVRLRVTPLHEDHKYELERMHPGILKTFKN